jgi:hypothetical protein
MDFSKGRKCMGGIDQKYPNFVQFVNLTRLSSSKINSL